MKCGGLFSLLLVLSLRPLSNTLFIPPDLSPGRAMPNTSDATDAPITPLIIEVEVQEDSNGTSSSIADTTTPIPTLEILIDTDEMTGNPTQAGGGTTEPVWHPYLNIRPDNGEARTISRSFMNDEAMASTRPPGLEEEMIIELPPSTQEATTTTTMTPTAPQLIIEEFTLSPLPMTTESNAPESIVVTKLLETTPQPQSAQGLQLQFVSTDQSAPKPILAYALNAGT